MPASFPGKRKDPPKPFDSSSHRPAKRPKTKLEEARTILTSSDQAINKHGDLNVASFTKAREFEIKAMGASMVSSKKALSTRAFQQLPKEMRRRTASHNVKRVPKRLRARALKEMKDDKTPNVTSRRRIPTPHKRLRLENAKKLKKMGTLTKKSRAKAQHERLAPEPGETDPEKMVAITPRLPKLRKNTLNKPQRPPAKFRKRQIHKSWLPTHVWHAKRAKMTEPKVPLWRFAIPLSPTEKCFRVTHRGSSLRGCVAWDMSYMSTIGLEGVEASITGLLRALGVEDASLNGSSGRKWRTGTRSWKGWLREREGEARWITPVMIVWCAIEGHLTTPSAECERKKVKRRLFVRVHPSAFSQVWNELLKSSKLQRPQVMIEDLRFEIGSIEIAGPDAMEALIGVLHPVSDEKTMLNETIVSAGNHIIPPETSDSSIVDPGVLVGEDESDWVNIPSSDEVFSQLSCVTNPSSLPTNAFLAFSITDPRLQHPPRTIQNYRYDEDNVLNLLSTWPPDETAVPPSIFNRTTRLTASRLPSQKAVNRRKADADPGMFPSPLPKDPKIPVMLLVSRNSNPGGTKESGCSGGFTLLLPWSCVQPVWYSLMHYPLSSGGTPRFGGLQEKRQNLFESQAPWFPGDFPGTPAGWAWEMMERERGKTLWDRKPKSKRCAWQSVDLGGRKGEIGLGWGCDWERLFSRPSTVNSQTSATRSEKEAEHNNNNITSTEPTIQTSTKPPNAQQVSTTIAGGHDRLPLKVPLSIHHIPSSNLLSGTLSDNSSTALTTIHLALLAIGHPSRNARIYRLPTISTDLRARWLALASSSTKMRRKSRNPSNSQAYRLPPLPKNAPQYAKAQRLAASLIAPQQSKLPKEKDAVLSPSDSEYPPVPEEDDLIGYVTSANFQLGEGRCEAIGNVAVSRAMDASPSDVEREETIGKWDSGGGGTRTSKREARLCIVRDAGQSIGRLAWWSFT